MNPRGSVIPTIDLARLLGMQGAERTERSAIVVAEAGSIVVGLVVDHVTDMLSILENQLQPVPDVLASFDRSFCEGMITHGSGMICFLNLDRMFERFRPMDKAA